MRISAAGLLVLLCVSASAEETAQFLKVGVGARALGMGGAYTALAEDVSAVSWNPAGLSLLTRRELGGMHAELSEGMRYNFLGYAHPAGRGVLGAGLMHLSQGSLQGRDDSGRLAGGYSASDTAVSLSYARGLGRGLSLGLTAKAISSRIGSDSGQSTAFDAGGLYDLGTLGPGKARLGAAVLNMGPELKQGGAGSPLPLTFALGFGYKLPVGLTLAADFKRRPYAGASEASLGTEYALLPAFAVRAGYASSHGALSGSKRLSDLSGFTTGFGVKVGRASLDYSLTPYGGLGNAHRVSLGARW